MADQKLTQLTALASLSADDLFYVVDDPAGAANQRKMAASVLDAKYLQVASNLGDLNNAATARTNLGLVAGGAGDIWVEKAGDTMTGTLNITVPTTTATGLLLKTTDNNTAKNLLELQKSDATVMGYFPPGSGTIVLNNGYALPALDASVPTYKLKIVDDSGEGLSTGMYFQNRAPKGYTEFIFANDHGDLTGIFVFGLAGSTEEFGYADTAYFYGGNEIEKINFEVRKAGAYFLFQYMDTDFNVTPWMVLKGGDVGIANANPSASYPAATLHVEQGSATAAKPTLRLRQVNLSQEFIRFQTTVGTGNPINTTALGAYYGRVRVYVEGVGAKWLALYD